MSVWGISWGGSWGDSWGPLHAVDQEQGAPEIYGKTCSAVEHRKRRTRKLRPEPIQAGILLEFGFSVASVSGISLASSVDSEVILETESSASLLIGAYLSSEMTASVKSDADIHDIVLEMMLLAA